MNARHSLVLAARNLGVRVMDRCNLTVLEQPEQEGTAQFLAANQVEIVASLPCYHQMLGLPLSHRGRPRVHLRDLAGADLTGNPILVKEHCYGCTAGQGPSCGGALAA